MDTQNHFPGPFFQATDLLKFSIQAHSLSVVIAEYRVDGTVELGQGWDSEGCDKVTRMKDRLDRTAAELVDRRSEIIEVVVAVSQDPDSHYRLSFDT